MDFIYQTLWRLYHGKLSGFFCFSLFVLCMFSLFFVAKRIRKHSTAQFFRYLPKFECWVILTIPVLMFFWASYPGIYVTDSMLQLGQAVSCQFGDWHPPLMSWIWAGLIDLTKMPESLYWLHLIIVLFSLAVWFFLIIDYYNVPRWCLLVVALVSPVYLLYCGVVIKDTGTAFGLLAAFGLLLLCRSGKINGLWAYPIALILLFYSANVRQNALPATFPALFLIFFYSLNFKFKKLTSFCLAGLTLGFFHFMGNFIKYGILDSQRNYVEQTLMLHDLVFITKSGSCNHPIPADFLTERYRESSVGESWVPGSSATLYLQYDNPNHPLQLSENADAIKQLRSSWMAAIVDQPFTYLRHRFIVFTTFMGIQGGYFNQYSAFQKQMDKSFGLHLPNSIPGSRYVEHVLSRTVGFLNKWTPLFSVWFWLLSLAMISLFSFRRLTSGDVYVFSFAISLSGLFYILPYFFILPHCEFRYVYWSAIAAIFSFVLLFGKCPSVVKKI